MKEKRLTEKQENYEASKLKIKKTRRNLPKRLNGALDKPVIVLKQFLGKKFYKKLEIIAILYFC